MAMVFKSRSDASETMELVGVGVLFPGAKGGIPVERAAEVMPELQEKNDDGSLKFDENGATIPLTGSKLTAAAKAWADAHEIDVANLNDQQIANLPSEWGAVPDRPPAAEVAMDDYARVFGDVAVQNDDPVFNSQGTAVLTDTEDSGKPPLPSSAENPKLKGGD